MLFALYWAAAYSSQQLTDLADGFNAWVQY